VEDEETRNWKVRTNPGAAWKEAEKQAKEQEDMVTVTEVVSESWTGIRCLMVWIAAAFVGLCVIGLAVQFIDWWIGGSNRLHGWPLFLQVPMHIIFAVIAAGGLLGTPLGLIILAHELMYDPPTRTHTVVRQYTKAEHERRRSRRDPYEHLLRNFDYRRR